MSGLTTFHFHCHGCCVVSWFCFRKCDDLILSIFVHSAAQTLVLLLFARILFRLRQYGLGFFFPEWRFWYGIWPILWSGTWLLRAFIYRSGFVFVIVLYCIVISLLFGLPSCLLAFLLCCFLAFLALCFRCLLQTSHHSTKTFFCVQSLGMLAFWVILFKKIWPFSLVFLSILNKRFCVQSLWMLTLLFAGLLFCLCVVRLDFVIVWYRLSALFYCLLTFFFFLHSQNTFF